LCRVAANRGGGPPAAAGPAHSLLLPGLLLRGVEIGLLSALYVPIFGRRRVCCSVRSKLLVRSAAATGKEVLRSVAAARVRSFLLSTS